MALYITELIIVLDLQGMLKFETLKARQTVWISNYGLPEQKHSLDTYSIVAGQAPCVVVISITGTDAILLNCVVDGSVSVFHLFLLHPGSSTRKSKDLSLLQYNAYSFPSAVNSYLAGPKFTCC
jgi:hypothetical protein